MLLKGRPDTLFVNIFNRRRVECRNSMPENTASEDMPLADEFEEGNAPVGPQQPQLGNTTFEIDLSAAYLGKGPFELKLEYRDNQDFDENDDRIKADMLTFLGWEGLDRTKILVTPIHVESLPCIKLRDVFHQFAANPANQNVNVQNSGGFWNFITTAWAGSDWRKQKKFIRNFTRRKDQRSKSRINSYFEQKKEEVAPVSTSILSDIQKFLMKKRPAIWKLCCNCRSTGGRAAGLFSMCLFLLSLTRNLRYAVMPHACCGRLTM